MLGVVILATTLWVCPGDVYSNEPREGCKPFQETEGTVSTTPEPNFGKDSPSTPTPSGSRPERKAAPESVNTEMCALYKEYIDLEIKTQGGFQLSGPEQSQRWQTLKRMFQNSPAPSCP